MTESLNRVEISRQALEHNFLLLRQLAAPAGVMAMVKADGYGHGMVECARLYSSLGVTAFGVAESVEGVRLRQAGIGEPVYVLAGVTPGTVPALLDHDLTPVLVDETVLAALSREAVQRRQTVGVHVKVDAGMGRQGCSPGQAEVLARLIGRTPGVELQGMMIHFPMADDPASESTGEILTRFRRLRERLNMGNSLVLHAANSGALMYFSGCTLDMVRPGIALYGCYPSGRVGERGRLAGQLKPAMRFVSRVIQVREVEAGTGLGYGHTHVTARRSRIALVPVGYEDGYLRALSNRARVLVRGRRVPVVGRISMNLTMLDVTDLAEVQVEDEVVLMGRQGEEEITPEEVAGWMETISYEVLCLFGNLNRRVYT